MSRGGALLTSRGGTNSQLAWIARDGTTKVLSKETHHFEFPRLSPDGSRIAVTLRDHDKSNIGIYDIPTSTFSRLSSAGPANAPSWTPDGKRVVYAALGDKGFTVWSQNADGGSPADKLFDIKEWAPGVIISPDGRSAIYVGVAINAWQLFRVALDSPSVARRYLTVEGGVVQPSFSPDGNWVAVTSWESGQPEVSVRSFPDASVRVQISAGGGYYGSWSADGKQLFYVSGRALMSAKLSTTPSLRVLSRDTAVAQFPSNSGSILRNYDLSRDGRFLSLVTNKNDYQIVVVPNWLQELKRRLSGTKQ